MKLFNTSDIETVQARQKFSGLALPSVQCPSVQRSSKTDWGRLLSRRIYIDIVETIVDVLVKRPFNCFLYILRAFIVNKDSH